MDAALFKSEVRDGMRIDWDVPIAMDDGIVLRADVFAGWEGRYPVIMGMGSSRSRVPGRLESRVGAAGVDVPRGHRGYNCEVREF